MTTATERLAKLKADKERIAKEEEAIQEQAEKEERENQKAKEKQAIDDAIQALIALDTESILSIDEDSNGVKIHLHDDVYDELDVRLHYRSTRWSRSREFDGVRYSLHWSHKIKQGACAWKKPETAYKRIVELRGAYLKKQEQKKQQDAVLMECMELVKQQYPALTLRGGGSSFTTENNGVQLQFSASKDGPTLTTINYINASDYVAIVDSILALPAGESES